MRDEARSIVGQTARDNHWSPDSQTIKAFVQSPTAFLSIHTCSKVLWTMLKLASPAQPAGSILKYLSIFSTSRAKRRKAQDSPLKEDAAFQEGSFATDTRNSMDSARTLSQAVLPSWSIPFWYPSALLYPYQCEILCTVHRVLVERF